MNDVGEGTRQLISLYDLRTRDDAKEFSQNEPVDSNNLAEQGQYLEPE
jgi:hypothetical protein